MLCVFKDDSFPPEMKVYLEVHSQSQGLLAIKIVVFLLLLYILLTQIEYFQGVKFFQ